MTKQTQCNWYGLPALPLNEATIEERWDGGECRLHVFGPQGVLWVSHDGSADGFDPSEEVEIMVELSADCGLLDERRRPFNVKGVPDEVLCTLEGRLLDMGYSPDGPIEFARKASTPEQRALCLAWATKNKDWYREAGPVLALLGERRVAA